MIKMKIRNIISALLKWYRGPQITDSSETYIHWMRQCGIKIGERCVVFNPKKIEVDITHPELIEIGNHVFLHAGTTLMTHDWTGHCFVESHGEFIPSHRSIKIGNNVWFGMNVTVLGGVKIGDNVIIGFGSIVTKDIPSNSVAVGVPAKVVCSYEEYYQKRLHLRTKETIELANAILDRGREPVVQDFRDDYSCFVDGSNWHEYDYPHNVIFNEERFSYWKQNHKKEFDSFEDFIKYVKNQRSGTK